MIEEDGLALRGTFVINPEGEIKVIETHDLGIGRDAGELVRKIQAHNMLLHTMVKYAQLNGSQATKHLHLH
jgi:alkyl hydroperoxide reductase subunit AhpC